MNLDGLPYLAALVLAALFLLSAVAKWRDLPAAARAFRALGVPRPWTAVRVVPGVEAGLATVLVLAPEGAAMLAFALLVAFTVFLVARLRAGVTEPCRCFGGWGFDRLSWADVVRNGWLLSMAVVAMTGRGPVAPSPGAVLALVAWVGAAVASVRWTARIDRVQPTRP
ncbi:MAG: methylamine utilization protein MauE [Acidimicrobiales bacterium]|nr:methylamine utilization protein MauE [Acidimicrobiales bacterium]